MLDEKLKSVYAAEIFRLAEERKDENFYNSSAEHAAIVHRALAKYATEYIDIFSSSMCSDVSNNAEYCRLIKAFLDTDSKRSIRIILTDYSDSFLKTDIAGVLAGYPSQVSVKSYNGKVMYKGKPAHFTVSDGRAFRLETDIDARMAFGNFNSPGQAGALENVFDKIFKSRLVEDVRLN
ncbi:hypothetical protein [Bacteroides sp. ET225]|uniref:hypothetical protein n=1 Tax=Bacteroides sp. ET225 TaxID=2972461 RepID=UPI0021ABFB1F|nr:hypothetical protein [Bacteroides sp. ET225]MCR8919230.1 hypothetical protein [Bacteroides sp. ET225]